MQFGNLLIIEPIAKSVFQQCFRFAIHGIHRDCLGTFYIYYKHLKWEETPAPNRVGEEIVAIDRCYETCQVRSLFDVFLIRHTVLHLWAGNQVLQFVLVSFGEGFELVIDIDDEVLTDKAQHILFLRIYLSRILIV